MKFGGAIGALAARWCDPTAVSYFDWHGVGMRSSGALAYRTQLELEAVCRRWRDVLSQAVFPWFDDESRE